MTDDNETYDELAGVVDLFGALTRDELRRALDELAYKQGKDADSTALGEAVEAAVDEYYLVEYDPSDTANATSEGDTANVIAESDESADDDPTLLTVGPVAFPILPPNAEDLPHIMDVGRREVDREPLGEQVHERLLGDAARAVNEANEQRAEHLLDVSYDLEAWAPVEVDSARERLDEALGNKTAGRQ